MCEQCYTLLYKLNQLPQKTNNWSSVVIARWFMSCHVRQVNNNITIMMMVVTLLPVLLLLSHEHLIFSSASAQEAHWKWHCLYCLYGGNKHKVYSRLHQIQLPSQLHCCASWRGKESSPLHGEFKTWSLWAIGLFFWMIAVVNILL